MMLAGLMHEPLHTFWTGLSFSCMFPVMRISDACRSMSGPGSSVGKAKEADKRSRESSARQRVFHRPNFRLIELLITWESLKHCELHRA